jgi:DegV family protein with EDD domain
MAKTKIALVTDSTSNLIQDQIDRYNIHVVPLVVIWEGETYRDGVDITKDEFYERLKTAKELPTTSQPSAGEFHKLFSKIAETSDSIVGVFVSDRLSGTLDSARTAAKMMPDEFPIEIVDSRSTSMGLGFIALKAATAIEDGKSFEEVVDVARSAIPKAHAVFVVDTLEFLHRQGRIGGASRLLGSLVSIKPLLYLEDGLVEPLSKVRTKKKALQEAIDYVVKDIAGRGSVNVAIVHAAAPAEAEAFKAQVMERLQLTEISVHQLTPVLGANSGPGLVGIAYITEN